VGGDIFGLFLGPLVLSLKSGNQGGTSPKNFHEFSFRFRKTCLALSCLKKKHPGLLKEKNSETFRSSHGHKMGMAGLVSEKNQRLAFWGNGRQLHFKRNGNVRIPGNLFGLTEDRISPLKAPATLHKAQLREGVGGKNMRPTVGENPSAKK